MQITITAEALAITRRRSKLEGRVLVRCTTETVDRIRSLSDKLRTHNRSAIGRAALLIGLAALEREGRNGTV